MIARSRLIAILLAASAATPALAVGPSKEVVQERLYSFNGRFDVSVLAGVAMNAKLIDQYGLILQPAYHFTDAWALELTGGYVFAAEKRRLTGGIREAIGGNGELTSEFADMGTLEWLAQASIQWSPIYGKLSLASELPLHFGAYLSAGGGFVGTSRRSLVQCSAGTTDANGYYDADCNVEKAARPSVGVGVGLKFYFADWGAVRAEMKDFLFPDQYRLYIGLPEERTVNDFTSVLMFMAGASFYF